jgi:hypothetical protein
VRGSRAAKAAGVVAWALAAACSSVGGGGRPSLEGGPRIWVPGTVYWEPGGVRHLEFAIENDTSRTILLAEPDPANARVAVFPGADAPPACGVQPHPTAARARPLVRIPPGGSLPVRVELGEACGSLPPGEYRFEVDYRSPAVDAGEAFSGGLATRYGVLFVEGAGASGGAASADPARGPTR